LPLVIELEEGFVLLLLLVTCHSPSHKSNALYSFEEQGFSFLSVASSFELMGVKISKAVSPIKESVLVTLP